MKKSVLLLTFLFIFTSIILPQEIIENPKKPMSKNAGRVLNLEEVFRITDESSEFYFKHPRDLKIAPDGSLFIIDYEQLLQFDSNGNFIKNFFKKGQGPGELSFISSYCFKDQNIIIHNRTPNKIVWFDFNGNLINEFRIHGELPRRSDFRLFYNNTYYFIKSDSPYTKGKIDLIDSPQVLVAITQDRDEVKSLISFPIKIFAIGARGQGAAWYELSSLITALFKDKYLFISHTREYLLKLYDVESQKFLRSFNRDYKRVKTPKDSKEGGIGWAGKFYSPPRQKYMSDIRNLFVFNGLLWVVTSTINKKKGDLIDVFNFDGEFIDSFFINPKGYLMTAHKDSIFVLKRDEAENFQIVKYKIIDGNQMP
jgi:hypothetical protein